MGAKGSDDKGTSVRIIRKYSNRRLYDTTTSSYVTLNHLRDMLNQGIIFNVVHADTQENITHATLFQIFATFEERACALFPLSFLQQLMHASAHSAWNMTTWYQNMSHALDRTAPALDENEARSLAQSQKQPVEA